MTTTTISKGNFLRSFSPPYRGQTVVQFRSEITSWVDRPVVFHFVQDERFETNYKFQSPHLFYSITFLFYTGSRLDRGKIRSKLKLRVKLLVIIQNVITIGNNCSARVGRLQINVVRPILPTNHLKQLYFSTRSLFQRFEDIPSFIY